MFGMASSSTAEERYASGSSGMTQEAHMNRSSGMTQEAHMSRSSGINSNRGMIQEEYADYDTSRTSAEAAIQGEEEEKSLWLVQTLTSFYEQHDPAKIENIARIIEMYPDLEEMGEKLTLKYGEGPDLRWSWSSGNLDYASSGEHEYHGEGDISQAGASRRVVSSRMTVEMAEGGGREVRSWARTSTNSRAAGADDSHSFALEQYKPLLQMAWMDGSLARGEHGVLVQARQRYGVSVADHRRMLTQIAAMENGHVSQQPDVRGGLLNADQTTAGWSRADLEERL
jgi:hypothetical protein